MRKNGRLNINRLWLSSPWNAAAGVDLQQLEVLIHCFDRATAVAFAQPAAVPVFVARDKRGDNELTVAIAEE